MFGNGFVGLGFNFECFSNAHSRYFCYFVSAQTCVKCFHIAATMQNTSFCFPVFRTLVTRSILLNRSRCMDDYLDKIRLVRFFKILP